MPTAALLSCLIGPASVGAQGPHFLVADVNCDDVGSAADFSAAIVVAADDSQFPDCEDADPFRGQRLTDADFLPVLHDLFDTFSPRFTPTQTLSPTVTPTPAATNSPTRTAASGTTATSTPTPSPSATSSPTNTASATPTLTPTWTPANTATSTPTLSPTPTRTSTPSPTPTGVAYQLSGDWFAHWSGQICYLNGLAFRHLEDTTYRVTAVDGTLDIQIVGGASIGRGLRLDGNSTVVARFTALDNTVCLGVQPEFVFDYTFTFHTNGTGTASAEWSYGYNTNCAVCSVTDHATLVRVAGPGA